MLRLRSLFLTESDHLLFGQNDHAGTTSHVHHGHYNTYESFANPSNRTYANVWATTYADPYDSAPFVNSRPLLSTGNTFTAGAAHNDGISIPDTSYPYACGSAVATAYPNNHVYSPLVDPNPLQLTEDTFATSAAYNNGLAFPNAPYPYNWEEAAAPGPTDYYVGTGFQDPDPSFPMMDSYPTSTTGNSYYQHQLPAPITDAPFGAAFEPPNAVSTANNGVIPVYSVHEAPPRPTCTNCNRSFGRQADLDRHAKKHQADPNAFRCAVAGCGYSSYRKDKLNEHVRRRHRVAAASSAQV